LLRSVAREAKDRPALRDAVATLTFGGLDAGSDAVAAALQRGGLRRGDRVALFAGNSVAFVAALFAIWKAGGVLVPISAHARAPKAKALLQDCTVQALIASSAVADVVASVAGEVPTLAQVLWTDVPPAGAPPGLVVDELLARPEGRPRDPGLIDQDLAAVVYTSGTTGMPKGVMLTHANFANTSWAIADYLGNRPDDLVLCALPLTHTYGLFQVLVGVRVGHPVALEASFTFPYAVLERLQQLRATGLPGVPALWSQVLQLHGLERLDLSSLRYLTNAAGPLPPAQLQRLRALFPQTRIFPMYGLTECSRVCYLDPDLVDTKVGSVGKAMPNCEAYVVDEQGHRVGHGVVGELVVRGANVMRGYWRRPHDTQQAFVDGDLPGDKALRSGDLFRTDAEGFLYFVGRSDDVFKCKGEKVSPAEVESVLCQSPVVADAAVFGVPSAAEGMSVYAALVLHDGAQACEQDLRRHCRANLESFAVPRHIEFRASLPKTESGKLDRRALQREVVAREQP
jgi:amino acid adenylation domain-containing protein